ncbi:aldo/keto reductase [Pigmentiphaga aceris]|uniref:Aldo/keto reductase n=1 Tax=Pigmentiphaga aceris TaxID=1940612 RepID=A0A5C0B4G8_9BURK|nr:aldo/keto reductase [Pigmentiphaga aceris]QEI08844.1 aldo/keto reductase [Pigmentiphaga aceris]
MPINRRELLISAGAGALVAAAGAARAQNRAAPDAAPLGTTGGISAAPTGEPIRKTIPATGETMVPVGIGTARRYQGAASPEQLAPLRAAIQTFHRAGGTVIDTAPSYGDAEAVVGRLLADLGLRKELFLATKVGASGRDAGLLEIEQSFDNLRTDKIDLIAVHNLRDTATQLETLRDLKAAERIRYVGVTTSFENQHADMAALIAQAKLDFVQVDYAIDNRAAADTVLRAARDYGAAVMINLPFGRGRVFEAVKDRPLPDWAAEFDCKSWAQFFLKYVISHEAVTCVIPGTANARYAADNIGAAYGRLPDPVLRKRMEVFIDGV